MRATKVVFHRPHKFVEGNLPFTPAQIASATYKLLVGSAGAPSQSYAIPAALLAPFQANQPVTVPFNSVGFTPVNGKTYTASVIVDVDGVESAVSPAVTFTNSLTPAAVDTVSVA